MPGLLLRAGLRHQTRHPWQAALALLGIALGVAVVLAVDLANDAAKASFAESARQLSGQATHRLVSPSGTIDEAFYRDLFTREGAPPMAPVIEARVHVAGRDGALRLLGLDAFAEGAFRDSLGGVVDGGRSLAEWLADPSAVAMSQTAADALDLAAGDHLAVSYQGRTTDLRLFAITDSTALSGRNLVVVDIATAQVVTGLRGRLSHIDLALDPAQADAMRERLPPGTRLVSVEDQLSETAGLSAAFELNLQAMSLLALLVGMFLIFNAISFSIVQRRRLLGRLRALGVTATEINRLVLAEAFVLALIGSLLGSLLGGWLAEFLTRIVTSTVSALYYDVAPGTLSWRPVTLAKAWLLGVGATLVAAWLPARQAAATPPLTTLSRAALEQGLRRSLPRLGALGLVLVTVGLLVAVAAPGGVVPGFAGLFLLIIGAAVLTPLAISGLHRLLRPVPLTGVNRMAARDIERHLSRLGPAGAALMVALAASIGVAVMVESMRVAVSDWLDALLTADVYITADRFDEGAPLPASVLTQVGASTAVGDLSLYRDRRLQFAHGRITLIGSKLAPASRQGFEFVDGDRESAWRGVDAGGLLISEPLASRTGLGAGDRLVLPTPGGDVELAVSGVFRDFASEHGRAFVDLGHFAELWGDDEVDTLAVFARPGIDTPRLLDDLERALAERGDVAFTLPREIYDESLRIFDRTFRITDVLRWLSIAVAFVGVFSALMALQLERGKEYAVYRALGLTRSQVARLILSQSLAIGILAALLAIPVGLAMAWILTAVIQVRAFGWSMPLAPILEPYGMALLIGAAAALLASLLPAWRAARQNPAAQLRED
jgi:putative ABC transport system permease protein